VTEGASFQPRRTWRYTAEELQQYQIRTSIGIGYQLALQWGEAAPTQNKIAVLVRYIGEQGGVLTSAPSVIAVALK
jgi:hypothetical protein